VPIADEHLDRRHHCLIAIASLGAMSLLESQAFKIMLKLGGRRIEIISHLTVTLTMQVANFCSKNGGEWAQSGLFARSK
jgi:hypothetical protein